ncbi:uncharacterized protein PRCAT00001668001 [Priceomyces carsonii]|uniref:uncharacterized protein n=1 Tax=Priceomyces carsonii TaxID=28549 RepID=UPI002EDA1912|nr:unnamed protein product [Priceomyces carsonii]
MSNDCANYGRSPSGLNNSKEEDYKPYNFKRCGDSDKKVTSNSHAISDPGQHQPMNEGFQSALFNALNLFFGRLLLHVTVGKVNDDEQDQSNEQRVSKRDNGEENLVYYPSEDISNETIEDNEEDNSIIIVDALLDQLDQLAPFVNPKKEEQSAKVKSEAPQQYGTSFGISQDSKYLSSMGNRNYKPELNRFADDNSSSTVDVLNLIPNYRDEYKNTILKHYLPEEPVSRLKYSVLDSLLSNFHIDTISDLYKKEKSAVQDAVLKEREHLKTHIQGLSYEQSLVVEKSWSRASNEIIVSDFQIEICTRDLRTLKDGQWLNDNVIDFYFNLITSNDPKVYGWTTHFYTTLESKGYQGVSRWARRRKINLVEKDLILIPINIMETHWALAVVDNVAKSMKYFDSLTTNGNMRALKIISNYMNHEAERLNISQNYDDYTFSENEKTPQQRNGSDCGVFTCTCARFIAKHEALSFGQKDMKIIRRRMAYEIIEKKLLD